MTDADPAMHKGLEKFRWLEEYEFFNRIADEAPVNTLFMRATHRPLRPLKTSKLGQLSLFAGGSYTKDIVPAEFRDAYGLIH
jgi:hypothetical protein